MALDPYCLEWRTSSGSKVLLGKSFIHAELLMHPHHFLGLQFSGSDITCCLQVLLPSQESYHSLLQSSSCLVLQACPIANSPSVSNKSKLFIHGYVEILVTNKINQYHGLFM